MLTVGDTAQRGNYLAFDKKWDALLIKLREKYDFIVLEAATMPSSGTLYIATQADVVWLVTERHSGNIARVKKTYNALKAINENTTGLP